MNTDKSSIFFAIIISSIFFVTLFPGSGYGQSFIRNSEFRPHMNMGISAGTSLFFGDIKQYQYWPVSNYENEWRFAGGLHLGYQISPVFGVNGQGLYGKLAGTRRPSNKYFESSYIELNLHTTISIRNIITRYQSGQFWDAYIIFGVGLTNYNTELMELSSKKVIRKVGFGNGSGIGGRTIEGMLIGGLGAKFRLSDQWDITIQSANRGMSSDWLDGQVSGFKYDIYNYTSLGFTFKFGQKVRVDQKSERDEEEFDYFKSKTTTKTEPSKNKQPIEPAEIDMLFVAPPVIGQPVEPPKKPEPVIVVEEVITEEPVIVQQPAEPVFDGIEYRVQIRAKYGNPISKQQLSNSYNLSVSQIKENVHNGFYIYTVGAFASYEEARDKRNELRSHNGISDAFVVAFKNGERLNKLP